MSRLFIALQYVIPQHGLSRLVYRVTRSRVPALKNALISSFMRGFQPDMSDAAQPDPLSYPSFNEFFIRALRPGSRPMVPDELVLASPVDGTISQIGPIDGSQLLQAKGRYFSVAELLDGAGANSAWAGRFNGGVFATLYLAPFNYHRIHMPLAGTLRAAWYVPGGLFSVNATTANAVPRLFARNERIVCIFEAGPLVFALVLVGALFVGSMTTVWHGEITPRKPRRPFELALDESRCPLHLDKGAELGRFNMGSTVILLLPAGAAEWLPQMEAGSVVAVGQSLARLAPRS